LSGDAVVVEDDDDEEDVDDLDIEVCQIRVCQKMIEDLQLKIFNIERNLIGQIEMLKEKLEITSEGRKKKLQLGSTSQKEWFKEHKYLQKS